MLAFYVLGKSQDSIGNIDIVTQKAITFLEILKSEKKININIKDKHPLKLIKKNVLIGYKYDLLPQGFIIISPDDAGNSVMAYSYENNFLWEDGTYKISLDILEGIKETGLYEKSGKIEYRKPASEFGPLVKSLFGQVNCHDADGNIVNVSNLYTPNHYAPGCVAVSLATMLDYYQWPVQGVSEHIDKDIYGQSRGNYKAEFYKTNYDWEHILNRYNNKNTSLQEKKALGLLVYHAAIALDMDFEYNGSTSNVNRIPGTGKNYFRFYAKYASASSPIFWRTVDSCIVHKIPVVFAISGSGGIGHSIVCDGVRFEAGNSTFYHLNMGWWGSSNGWYRVKSNFNAGGYSKITGGTINFLPVPEIYNLYKDTTDNLTIHWRYSNVLVPQSFELQAKYDNGSWITVSDTFSQDSINIALNSFENTIQLRVRANILGKYFNDSWSNIVKFKKQANSNTGLLGNFSINIFPNPFKDYIRFDNKEKIPLDIMIINLQTQQIFFHKERIINTELINTTGWPTGIYAVMIRNSKLFLQKIIKID